MGDQRFVQPVLHMALFLLIVCMMSELYAFPFSPSLDLDVTPRTTVFFKGEVANQIVPNYSMPMERLLFHISTHNAYGQAQLT